MRRIRIALALASLAALGLVALLAWRANQGLAAERAVRHQAVAERAFEEMERALSEFLAREEARPFQDYAYSSPATGARSPLASGLESFVIGAFQIDPEGKLSTPLEPADVAVARVRAAVDGLWAAGAREEKDEGAAPPGLAQAAAQAPGTTRALAGPGVQGARRSARARGAGPRARARDRRVRRAREPEPRRRRPRGAQAEGRAGGAERGVRRRDEQRGRRVGAAASARESRSAARSATPPHPRSPSARASIATSCASRSIR